MNDGIISSNDLLSFDFLHDNPGNKQFFRNNEIYNLNDSSKFKINSCCESKIISFTFWSSILSL